MIARAIAALVGLAIVAGALGVYLLAGLGPTCLFIAACAFYGARLLARGVSADG